MFSLVLSYSEGTAQAKTVSQIPKGYSLPLAGLSNKVTPASLLVKLFDLMYLFHQKE